MRVPRGASIARALGALAIWLAPLGLAGAAAQETAAPQQPYGQAGGYQLGAPQSGILTIQPDRLFTGSLFGERVAREVEAEGAVLTAENRRIEAQLRAEEQDLTARRSSMEPEAFRALADAFDEKVQETRRVQEAKLREINEMGEAARQEFFTASLPILQQIMREAGAGAILEHSSVFLSAESADVTDLAIERIDAALGDGSGGGARP
ncbi:OmpH family outer membrane protein [Roseobacteraceae bacterium NS-SX3]